MNGEFGDLLRDARRAVNELDRLRAENERLRKALNAVVALHERVVPESEWVWCGYPGHFIAANNCRFHMHTRVGKWRISTVGDYWPTPLPGMERKRDTIGFHRFYETAIVEVEGHGEHGEGRVVGDYWIHGYEGEDAKVADLGHMRWCHLVAAGWTPDDGEPDLSGRRSDDG